MAQSLTVTEVHARALRVPLALAIDLSDRPSKDRPEHHLPERSKAILACPVLLGSTQPVLHPPRLKVQEQPSARLTLGMVQKRRFSGNTRNLSADPDRSRVGAGFRESLAAMLGLQFRENRVYPRSSSQ